MAMTKKEQAEFEELRQQLLLAKALRFTEQVERDLHPPQDEKIVNGWNYNDYIGDFFYSPRVEKACTASNMHGNGKWNHTNARRAQFLFSTRLKALRALRCAVEQKVASILAKIDAEIEKEIANPNTEVPNDG